MIPPRLAREYTHQLEHAGERERLASTLATIPIFIALYCGETVYEVLRYWVEIEKPQTMEEAYRRGLKSWQPTATSEQLCAALESAADLMERFGLWDAAADLFQQAIDLSPEAGDRTPCSAYHRGMGRVRLRQGRYDESTEEFTAARSICEELGDRIGMAGAVNGMGIVYVRRGEYDRALECLCECEAIYTELGIRRGQSSAMCNIGIVHERRGEYEGALECFRQSEAICRENGDRGGLSVVITNMGLAYGFRGENDRALDCLGMAESICRELGDRSGLSSVMANMGMVYGNLGEYDRARECYGESESICRDLGDRNGLLTSIGGKGEVHLASGEYERALECFDEQEAISRDIGDRVGLANAIGSRGLIHHCRRDFELAMECFQRALFEHRQIGNQVGVAEWIAGNAEVLLKLSVLPGRMPGFLRRYLPDIVKETWRKRILVQARADLMESIAIGEQLKNEETLFRGRVLLARLDAAEGRRDVAVQRLADMLANAADDEQRAELHYWLWKIASRESGVGARPDGDIGVFEVPTEGDESAVHRAEALRRYEALLAKTPKHEYRKRILELRAEVAGQ